MASKLKQFQQLVVLASQVPGWLALAAAEARCYGDSVSNVGVAVSS